MQRITAFVTARIGDAGEKLEGPVIILADAIAIRIHAAKLPLGKDIALLGSRLQLLERRHLVARTVAARKAAPHVADRLVDTEIGQNGAGQGRPRQ